MRPPAIAQLDVCVETITRGSPSRAASEIPPTRPEIIGGYDRLKKTFVLHGDDRRLPSIDASFVDVVELASIMVAARALAAVRHPVDAFLTRINFRNALGADKSGLIGQLIRLLLHKGRLRRLELVAQRRALPRQPALESFAACTQSSKQLAAISFAGGVNVRLAMRTDRDLKALQIDRQSRRLRTSLSTSFLQLDFSGDFCGAGHETQQPAEMPARRARSTLSSREKGGRFIARRAAARTIEQQIGKKRQSQP